MRRAIVHVGMPRNGSTSFQGVLARMRPRLGAVGLCYPELAPPGSPGSMDVNHYRLGQALDGRRSRAERRASLACLSEVLAQMDADTLILSHEDFAVQKPALRIPETLREIFERHGFAMEVAIVVKPQAEQLGSAYALRTQLVAEIRTFRGFVLREGRSARYDYAARLEPWRRAADGRVTAIPKIDRHSDAPLLARIVRALGLEDRLGPLLGPDDLAYETNRSSGPVAVEAARRLHALGVHRQVSGHPRDVGHFLDGRAWSRGLDAERFRGDAAQELRVVEGRLAASNARFADLCWGRAWEDVVACERERPSNELAERSVPPETEAQVERLVREAIAHFGFRTAPAWRRRIADFVEGLTEGLADAAGYSRWRVR